MAAILEPHRLPAVSPIARPDLRLIPGGRTTARRQGRSPLVIGTVAFVIAFTVLFGAIAVGRGALASLAPAPRPPAAASAGAGDTAVRVRAGDTIWSIARRLQPTGDVRPLVDRLIAANGSAVIQAGDRLIVPS